MKWRWMKSNEMEMKVDEIKWREMEVDEIKWSEMKVDEIKWNGNEGGWN